MHYVRGSFKICSSWEVAQNGNILDLKYFDVAPFFFWAHLEVLKRIASSELGSTLVLLRTRIFIFLETLKVEIQTEFSAKFNKLNT